MYIFGVKSNKGVDVNDEHHLRVTGISASVEHHMNHHDGRAFNISFSQSPTAGDDCIFYIVNNDDTRDLVIEGITLGFKNATAVDAEVYVKLGDKGTRNAATALTPVNLNQGHSGRSADGTFEKGADLDGGAATLTGGSEIERWLFPNVQDLESKHFNFNQDVILTKNETLTIWASDAGAIYYITVVFNYHDEDAA